MTIVLLGILFLIYAVLDWIGCPLFLPEQFRKAEYRKQLQKGKVVPNLIMGIGFIIMGIGQVYFQWEEKNQVLFCLGILVIGAVSVWLIIRNRMKYRGK